MNKLITTKPTEILTDRFCGQCGQSVFPQDNFCRACGACCHAPVGQVSVGHVVLANVADEEGGQERDLSANDPAQSISQVLGNRWLVIGIVALIGPLGLPALWFSPRFSRITKITSTVLYVLLSIAIPLLLVWYFLDFSVQPLVDAFGN